MAKPSFASPSDQTSRQSSIVTFSSDFRPQIKPQKMLLLTILASLGVTSFGFPAFPGELEDQRAVVNQTRVKARLGGRADLSCGSSGVPIIMCLWRRADASLSMEINFYQEQMRRDGLLARETDEFALERGQCSLTIDEVDESHVTSWECTLITKESTVLKNIVSICIECPQKAPEVFSPVVKPSTIEDVNRTVVFNNTNIDTTNGNTYILDPLPVNTFPEVVNITSTTPPSTEPTPVDGNNYFLASLNPIALPMSTKAPPSVPVTSKPEVTTSKAPKPISDLETIFQGVSGELKMNKTESFESFTGSIPNGNSSGINGTLVEPPSKNKPPFQGIDETFLDISGELKMNSTASFGDGDVVDYPYPVMVPPPKVSTPKPPMGALKFPNFGVKTPQNITQNMEMEYGSAESMEMEVETFLNVTDMSFSMVKNNTDASGDLNTTSFSSEFDSEAAQVSEPEPLPEINLIGSLNDILKDGDSVLKEPQPQSEGIENTTNPMSSTTPEEEEEESVPEPETSPENENLTQIEMNPSIPINQKPSPMGNVTFGELKLAWLRNSTSTTRPSTSPPPSTTTPRASKPPTTTELPFPEEFEGIYPLPAGMLDMGESLTSSSIPGSKDYVELILLNRTEELNVGTFIKSWNGWRYKFETVEKLNWIEAYKKCKKNGQELVSIHSEEEYIFLTRMVQRIGIDLVWNSRFWTSGTSRFSENGGFVWMGTGDKIGSSWWGLGEPNGMGKEPCIALIYRDYYGGYKLNDIKCDLPANYICKSKLGINLSI